MEEVDSRFQHLLQPIRDLTKNWEVDVAAQLGEYLEEVTGSCPHPCPCATPNPAGTQPLLLPLPAGSDLHFLRQRQNHHELCRGSAADPGLRMHLQQEGEGTGALCPTPARCQARSQIPELPQIHGILPESPISFKSGMEIKGFQFIVPKFELFVGVDSPWEEQEFCSLQFCSRGWDIKSYLVAKSWDIESF